MLGAITSKLDSPSDAPVCLEMEGCGLLLCAATAIAGYFTGGLACSLHSIYYRADMIAKYKIDVKDDIVCCICFDVFYRGVCYPLTYFQMYNSLKEWDQSNESSQRMIGGDNDHES